MEYYTLGMAVFMAIIGEETYNKYRLGLFSGKAAFGYLSAGSLTSILWFIALPMYIFSNDKKKI